MGAKKELRKRLEAISTVQEGDHGQVVDLRHRISELEAQLRDLPVVRGEALRTQLQQVQGAPVPAFPGFPNFAQDQLRLGALATQEATQAPRTNLVPRLLSEFPIAPGHDALLVQEGTRLLSWQPGAAQMRLDWADADKPAAELVRVQWCLIARHGPVEINIGSPIRGSAFFGDSMIPVVADGEQVYVGGDVLFGARVYLDERAHGRPLCGAQIIVHHAGAAVPGA